jgi:UDP-N-acetylglucosamine:LPS N-acetylglucosamine transferase
MSADRLGRSVAELLRSRNRLAEMGRSALARGKPEAAQRIVTELLSLVS